MCIGKIFYAWEASNLRLKSWLWVIPLLLLATWLGGRDLTIPLWFDEFISIYNAGGSDYGPLSVSGVLDRIAAEDPWQSPGYYVALSGWGALLGWTEFAGRVFSLLLGLLVIAGMYRLGADLISPAAGLGGAVTLGASAFYLNYMHEMRGYTLYPLLAIIAVWSYWRMVSRERRPSLWVQAALVLSISGLFYTHYFASLTVVALSLYHLLFVAKNRRWWHTTGLMVLGGLLFLPWLGVALEIALSARDNPDNVRHLSLTDRQVIQDLLHMFSNGSIALFGFLAVFSLTSLRRRAVRLTWFWFIVALALSLLVNHLIGVLFAIRHLMGLFPALAMIAGSGIDQISRAGVKPVYILLIWVVAGAWNTFDLTSYHSIRQPYTHLRWNALADALSGHVQPDDRVVFLLPHPANRDMHEMVAAHYLRHLLADYRMMESAAILDDEYTEHAFEAIGDAPRLFVAYDAEQPPDHQFQFDSALIDNYTLCGTLADTNAIHVNVYAPNNSGNPLAQFGDGIGVALLMPIPDTIDDTLSVLLGWMIDEDVPADTYSVALHLIDSDGNLVQQADYGLPMRAFSCRSNDFQVGGLAAGDYELHLIVYNWSNGERLLGKLVESGEQGDSIQLARFSIHH